MAAGKSRDSADRLSLQTLVIASVASAAAAIATSQFWEGGKVVTAALTPVIVAVVSELLHRPTERIRTVTAAPRVQPAGPAERADPLWSLEAAEGRESRTQPRVYGRRRRLHLKLALVTGAVAFAVAVLALTVPELIAGSSLAGGGRDTTFFSGGNSGKRAGEDKPAPVETAPSEETETDPEEQVPTTAPTETEQPEQTAPTETQPPPTETAPAPLPETAPQP